LIDTATTKIVIRKIPKRKEEGSTLTVFWVRRLETRLLTNGFTNVRRKTFQGIKGEFLRVSCGCIFPKREIEEPLLRALRAKKRRMILLV
jgi:hypothetical protein